MIEIVVLTWVSHGEELLNQPVFKRGEEGERKSGESAEQTSDKS